MNSVQVQHAIELHGEHMLKIAFFFVKNRATAEDIVQDVFVQLLGNTTYEERGNLRAYLSKLTANRSKDYLKSWRYRMVSLVANQEVTQSFKERDALIIELEKNEIGHAILDLPIKYREPIILYYYEELPIAEIAEHLRLPLNTVKTHLRKARQLLHASLDPSYWEVLKHESMEA